LKPPAALPAAVPAASFTTSGTPADCPRTSKHANQQATALVAAISQMQTSDNFFGYTWTRENDNDNDENIRKTVKLTLFKSSTTGQYATSG
jgi:hypothetical protein